MLLREFRAGLVYGAAEVLLGVPRHSAHVGQELLHARDIGPEQLAVQVAGVPIEQDPAHVPQDRFHRLGRGRRRHRGQDRADALLARHGKEPSEVGCLRIDD